MSKLLTVNTLRLLL